MPTRASMADLRPTATHNAISGCPRPPYIRWCSLWNTPVSSDGSLVWRAVLKCWWLPNICLSYADPNRPNPCERVLGGWCELLFEPMVRIGIVVVTGDFPISLAAVH